MAYVHAFGSIEIQVCQFQPFSFRPLDPKPHSCVHRVLYSDIFFRVLLTVVNDCVSLVYLKGYRTYCYRLFLMPCGIEGMLV